MKLLSNIYTSAKSKIQSIARRVTDSIHPKERLTRDVVELSPDAIATRIMNEVREYGKKTGLETAKIIDKNGEILKVDIIETPQSVIIQGKSTMDLVLKLEDTHFIHNHNVDLPLSTTDIGSMLDYQLAKMTATTPSGGVSTLEFSQKMKYRLDGDKILHPEVSHFTVADDINEIANAEAELLKKLGIYYEDINMLEQTFRQSPKEVIKQIADFRHCEIQKLADKYGFKYTYTPA